MVNQSSQVDWTQVNGEDIPFGLISDREDIQELQETASKVKDLEESVSIPYVLESKVLISPGTWNKLNYPAPEIKKAFEQTNWKDKKIISLFLDHEDNRAGEWIGYVKNPAFKNGTVYGDLEIIDKNTAIKLDYGATFGISPKLIGDNDNGTMKDFSFENFSIVFNPAVKTAFINNFEVLNEENGKVKHTFLLSDKKEGENMAEEEKESQPEESQEEKPEESQEAEPEEEKSQEKPEEQPESEEAPEEESSEEETPEGESESEEPESESESEEAENAEEDLTQEDILEITSNSEWTDFVSKMKKKYPKMSFKDIAKEFKKKKQYEQSETGRIEEKVDGLSGKLADLVSAVDELKKKKYPYKYKKKKYPYPYKYKKKKSEKQEEKQEKKKEEACDKEASKEDTKKEEVENSKKVKKMDKKEVEQTLDKKQPDKQSVKDESGGDAGFASKTYSELSDKEKEKLDASMAVVMLGEQSKFTSGGE